MSRKSRFFEPEPLGEMSDAEISAYLEHDNFVDQVIRSNYPDAQPAKVANARYWAIDGDTGVLVHVGRNAVNICLPTIKWVMTHQPHRAARLWQSIPHDDITEDALTQAIEEGSRKRRAEFVVCRFCRKPTPPERRNDDVCHQCAVKHLGVIH